MFHSAASGEGPGPVPVALGFLTGALVLYAPAIGGGLASDDLTLLGRAATEGLDARWGPSGFFRPVVLATFWLDGRLWGGSPVAMHAENVLLHAINALLVVRLGRSILPPETRGPGSIAAGLVFLAHPGHAESVAWVSGRTDLLATLFGLASVLAGLRYLREPGPAALVGSAFGLIGALLSKETGIVIPGVLAALALACRGSIEAPLGRRAAILLSVHALVGVAILALRSSVLGDPASGLMWESRFGPSAPSVSRWLGSQLFRTVFPPLDPGAAGIGPYLGGLATLVAVLAARLLLDPAQRATHGAVLAAIALAYGLALLPASGFPVSITTGSRERFLYLATIPASLGIAYLVGGRAPGRASATILLVLVAAYGLTLRPSVRRWAEAGAHAANVIETLDRERTGPRVAILNLPDRYEGTYVLRNGLPEALAMRSSSPPRVDVLSQAPIGRDGTRVRFARLPDRPDRWVFEQISPPHPLRYRRPRLVEAPEPRRFEITDERLRTYSDVFLFEGHALRRSELPPPPAPPTGPSPD